MFDPTTSLAHINLLLLLVLRLFGFVAPRAQLSLARLEAALAEAIRASLAEIDLAAPNLDDAALIAWFNRHRPGSDHTMTACDHIRLSLQGPETAFRFIPLSLHAEGDAFCFTPLSRREKGEGRANWQSSVFGQSRAPP